MEGKNLKEPKKAGLQIEAETNKKLSDLETQIKKNREKPCRRLPVRFTVNRRNRRRGKKVILREN